VTSGPLSLKLDRKRFVGVQGEISSLIILEADPFSPRGNPAFFPFFFDTLLVKFFITTPINFDSFCFFHSRELSFLLPTQ